MLIPQPKQTPVTLKPVEKLTSLTQFLRLSQHMKELEQWLGKMSGFFSISIKNIQHYSVDNLSFSERFAADTRQTDQGSYIGQFYSLVASFGLQLTYFQKNSKFVQTQFQSTYQQILRKFKSTSLDSEISVKTKQLSMQQSISDITGILQNLKEKVREKSLSASSNSSSSSSSSKSSSEDKQNLTQLSSNSKLSEFLTFFEKMIESSNKGLKQNIINSSKIKQNLGKLLFTLNEQIIFYAKKLHTIIASLFKSLLEQISTRFVQFKTPDLSTIFNPSSTFVSETLEMSLDEYSELNLSSTQQCTWLKGYMLSLKTKLSKRNQFSQKYLCMLNKYLEILQSITNQKHKSGQKESLKLLGKIPTLINQKTQVMVQSVQATSGCIIGIIEKLINQLSQNIKNTKTVVQKIDIFVKKFSSKIEQLEGKKNPKQVCFRLLELIKSIGNQEQELIKSFQQNIERIMQNIFMCFSEIQSRLLMINETYFGIGVRDITKHIKNWSKTHPQQLFRSQQSDKKYEVLSKANNILNRLKKGLNPEKKIIKFQAMKNVMQTPKQFFYCIYNRNIGVMNIFDNKVTFESFTSPSIRFTLNKEQITNILLKNVNELEIHIFKIEVFNCFNQSQYAAYLLKSLFLKKPTEINSKKSIGESETLDNSSEEEEQIIPQAHQLMSIEEQRERQIKLKEVLNKKLQNLSNATFENTNCIHLLHVLFDEKQFTCNGKKQRQFYYFFKEKTAQLNVKCESWSDHPMKYVTSTNIKPNCPLIFKRNWRFDHPIASMGIPFIPKTCNSKEVQSLIIVSKDKFIIESEVESTGAPYTDCFKLRARSIFTNIQKERVKLDILIEMEWVKRTMMKSMVQKQGYGETRVANQVFIKILKQSIVVHPHVVQAPISILKSPKAKQNKNKTKSKNTSFLESNSEPQNSTKQIHKQTKQIDKQIRSQAKQTKQVIKNKQSEQTTESTQLVLYDEQKLKAQAVYLITKRYFLTFMLSLLLQYLTQ